MKDIYFLLPLLVRFVVQLMKTTVDFFVKKKKVTLRWIFNSYWRFPSWHSAFMSSLVTLIYLVQWFSLLLLSVSMISILFWFDAINVRFQVWEQWRILNKQFKLQWSEKLRERVWHKHYEVIWWIILWIIIAILFYKFVS